MATRYNQPNRTWQIYGNEFSTTSNGNMVFTAKDGSGVMTLVDGAFQVPFGVSAERPVSSSGGMIRYNTTDDIIEYYNAGLGIWLPISQQPPSITTVSPNYAQNTVTDNSFVITGDNFDTNPVVSFISDTGGLTYLAKSQNRVSANTIIAVMNDTTRDLSNNYPYSLKVTNSSGLTATLDDAIFFNEVPSWVTVQSPSIYATVLPTDTLAGQLDLSASDPDNHVPLTFSSSDLSTNTGLSISSSGVIDGSLATLSPASYNFSAQVQDTVGGTLPGNFTFRVGSFIDATGGDVIGTFTDGGSGVTYKYHLFKTTGSSNFVVSSLSNLGSSYNDVEYLIVGAGGGGLGSPDCCVGGGAGGAGGVLSGTFSSLAATTYATSVGAGVLGANGQNTTIFSLIAYGGGRGANYQVGGNGALPGGGGPDGDGTTVGSGGGAAFTGVKPGTSINAGGEGTPGQGNNGGAEIGNPPDANNYYGGGGGGAGANGFDDYPITGTQGDGGIGITTTIITDTIATTHSVGEVDSGNVYFGGGGGSSVRTNSFGTAGLIAGRNGALGGGGNGKDNDNQPPVRFNGIANTGGGGGGGRGGSARTGSGPDSSIGGSGVIILRYRVSL